MKLRRDGRGADATRAVNEGFSGGEKKRNEILQMARARAELAILDETDSGLDIDALQIVADGVNALRSAGARDARGHALPAPARLHRARLRPRAGRRPHREVAAARSWRSSSRTRATAGSNGRRRGGADEHATRVPSATGRESFGRRAAASRRASRRGSRRCAPARARALRELGFPTHARRGVEVHERSRRSAKVAFGSRRPPTGFARRARRARPARIAEGARTLVFVNGRSRRRTVVASRARSPRACTLASLGRCSRASPTAIEPHLVRTEPLRATRAFAALNTAPSQRRRVRAACRATTTSTRPIRAASSCRTRPRSRRASHPRASSSSPRSRSRATIVESYVGDRRRRARHQRGHRDPRRRERRQLDHVQAAARRRAGVPRRAMPHARPRRSARVSTLAVTLGAALARNDIDVAPRRRGRASARSTASTCGRRPARRPPHDGRPREPPRHEPRAVQGRARRRVARRLQRQGDRAYRTRRRPTRSRRTATCCFGAGADRHASRSSRSTPTTSSAATARRSASSTRTRSSTCARAGIGEAEARSAADLRLRGEIIERDRDARRCATRVEALVLARLRRTRS